jgi:molecular chaperone GrpE
MNHDQNPLDELQDDQVDISAAGEFADGGAPASTSALLERIENLQNELTQAKEQSLRVQAEMQNVRRRAQQDVEKAHKFGLEKFVGDLLPVADNLARTLSAAGENSADLPTLLEGVELTLKTLLDALNRQQVVTVNPEGEPFDPQLHQAMAAVENRDVEPNTVLNVFQHGYTLHGRLVRPAMVVVSKAPT